VETVIAILMAVQGMLLATLTLPERIADIAATTAISFATIGGVRMLTAVVVDSEVCDDVFGERVHVNAEGNVVADDCTEATVGSPFTEDSVHRFVLGGAMGPGGATCLALAWWHRDALR
jgi:hypothetical protein